MRIHADPDPKPWRNLLAYLAVDPVLHDLPEERPVLLLQHVGALQVVPGVRLVQGQAHHLVPNQYNQGCEGRRN